MPFDAVELAGCGQREGGGVSAANGHNRIRDRKPSIPRGTTTHAFLELETREGDRPGKEHLAVSRSAKTQGNIYQVRGEGAQGLAGIHAAPAIESVSAWVSQIRRRSQQGVLDVVN